MTDTRKKNINWMINVDANGRVSNENARLAVLMDIRDELQHLNRRMDCWEVTEGFRSIRKNYLYTRKRWPLEKKAKRRRKTK